jgi:hypothetical protein
VLTGLIIYLAVSAACLLAYAAARPRLERRRFDRKLRAMTPDELATEARTYAHHAGYNTVFADAQLFRQPRDWSTAALARALDELYSKAAAQDQRDGHLAGPGSQVYFFYDCGLASIREALDDRPRA